MALERVIPESEHWSYSHADHLSRYLFAAPYVRDRRVLDAGCGCGYGSALLAEFGAREVVAIDIDEATIELAQKTYRRTNVSFKVCDCERLDQIAGEYDVICNFENIEHLRDPEAFLGRINSHMNSDGVLLCSSPDLRGPYDVDETGRTINPYHVNEWHQQEFEDLLRKYFDKVEMKQQVQAHGAHRRINAAKEINDFLAQMWSSPVRRFGRGIGKLFGRKYAWPAVLEVASPSPQDYPIVSSQIAHFFGVPYCHMAVCRQPIVRGSSPPSSAEWMPFSAASSVR